MFTLYLKQWGRIDRRGARTGRFVGYKEGKRNLRFSHYPIKGRRLREGSKTMQGGWGSGGKRSKSRAKVRIMAVTTLGRKGIFGQLDFGSNY